MEYDKFEIKIVLDLSLRSKDELIEQHREWLRQIITPVLDEFYGEDCVDLVYVTYEGKMRDEDPEDAHPGWGLSHQDIMDRIPGETDEEKQAWVKRIMEGEDGVDD